MGFYSIAIDLQLFISLMFNSTLILVLGFQIFGRLDLRAGK